MVEDAGQPLGVEVGEPEMPDGASVSQAQQTVTNDTTALNETSLLAPAAGTVAAVNVTVGSTVGSTSSASAASSAASAATRVDARTASSGRTRK